MLNIPTVKANVKTRKPTAEPMPTQPGIGVSDLGAGATSFEAAPPIAAPVAAPAGPGMSKNEYAASKMGGYDWTGRQDELLQNYADYDAMAQTAANTATEPTISWKSDTPGLMYNPGGGTDWTTLTPDMYSDPTVAGLVQTGAGRTSPAQGLFQAELGKMPASSLGGEGGGGIANYGPGGSGSLHGLPPEVINKMWR